MTRREQINNGGLRAQICIQPIGDGNVCIFCPAPVSERLYQHLVAKRISSSTPKRAIFGRPHSEDELIVTLSRDEASAEVSEFVASLPDVCYERDVA